MCYLHIFPNMCVFCWCSWSCFSGFPWAPDFRTALFELSWSHVETFLDATRASTGPKNKSVSTKNGDIQGFHVPKKHLYNYTYTPKNRYIIHYHTTNHIHLYCLQWIITYHLEVSLTGVYCLSENFWEPALQQGGCFDGMIDGGTGGCKFCGNHRGKWMSLVTTLGPQNLEKLRF